MRWNKIINKIVIVTILVISCCFNISYAASGTSPLTNPDYYKPGNLSLDTSSGGFMSSMKKLLGIINAIGVVVSVVIIMIIGIKYMVGSVQEKAEYKKTMLGYVLGAVLLFAATTLPNIIYNVATLI